jgi:hypothetical protein
LQPCSRQIRCTVLACTPCAFAIVRELQCVCPFGWVCRVALMIRSANPDCGLRPRPSAASHKLPGPSATTRRRQSRHACRFTPSSSAIAKSLYPWCASNTMRQRVTTCWGVPCARTHVSSSFCYSRSSLKITMQPVNRTEIDMSGYFSARTLASLWRPRHHGLRSLAQQLRGLPGRHGATPGASRASPDDGGKRLGSGAFSESECSGMSVDIEEWMKADGLGPLHYISDPTHGAVRLKVGDLRKQGCRSGAPPIVDIRITAECGGSDTGRSGDGECSKLPPR